MGDPTDFANFMGAVIDKRSFEKIEGYIQFAKRSKSAEVIAGGGCNGKTGWFIEPTVVLTTDPRVQADPGRDLRTGAHRVRLSRSQLWTSALDLCDRGSPYALTGAVFAQDRDAIVHMTDRLRHAAGNFYINDKPTGAVVNQQPFGGSRASGTNDKAGSAMNLLRWVSVRSIKETFVPPSHFAYPFLQPDAPGDHAEGYDVDRAMPAAGELVEDVRAGLREIEELRRATRGRASLAGIRAVELASARRNAGRSENASRTSIRRIACTCRRSKRRSQRGRERGMLSQRTVSARRSSASSCFARWSLRPGVAFACPACSCPSAGKRDRLRSKSSNGCSIARPRLGARRTVSTSAR